MISRIRIEAHGRTMAEVEATLQAGAVIIRNAFEHAPIGAVAPDMEMHVERWVEMDRGTPMTFKGRAALHLDVQDTAEQVAVLGAHGVPVSTWATV